MSRLRGLLHRLHVLWHGERYARELARELEFHLELAALADGGERSSRDAELAARRRFGNVTYYREETRRMTTLRWVDRMRQDMGYALRGLRRAPGFTSMVVTTLALGFGVNAAMFSMLDALFVQPPAGVVAPTDVRRLYKQVHRKSESGGIIAFDSFEPPEYRAIVDATGSIPVAATTSPDSTSLTSDGARIAVRQAKVLGPYFAVLGVRPVMGRFFDENEDRVDAPAFVAVISDDLWRRAFGASPSAIGHQVVINHRPFTIIGVTAKGFRGIDTDAADLWVPLNTTQPSSSGFAGPGGIRPPWYESFGISLHVVTRVSSPSAERALSGRATDAVRSVHIPGFVSDSHASVLSRSIIEALGPAKPPKEIAVATRLSVVSVIVLLIACANVMNLLLLRGARRQREIAVRRALGASRARLFVQVTAESTLLALLGGSMALFVASLAGAALRHLVMPTIHWAHGVIDPSTSAFILGLSVIVGLIAGIAPALQGLRPHLIDSLRTGARDVAYRSSRLRSMLLATQAALCVVLLVGAGLFLRSLDNVQSVDVGYDVENVTTVSPIFPEGTGQHAGELRTTIPVIADRLARMTGVEAVGYSRIGPMSGFAVVPIFFPDGDSLPRPRNDLGATTNYVSPDYFRATGIHLTAGRAFNDRDRLGTLPVMVVDETMARTVWPHEAPIGKCLILNGRTNPCTTVVGVVSDTHRTAIVENAPMLYYLPSLQDTSARSVPSTLVVRTRHGGASGVAAAAEHELRAQSPTIDGVRVRRMAEDLELELRPWRLGATLFTAFSMLALIVAGVGVYSVVAYGTAQRTHEIGVRLALGAQPSDVIDLVLADGLRVVVAGIAVGIVVCLLLGPLVASLLFGVTPSDPSVLIEATVVLCVLGAVASLAPAWRAARIDPAAALRAD